MVENWGLTTVMLQEIYQRSVQVESTSGGGTEITRKKTFPWFAK
jgi:hypothetical protein